MAEGRSDDRLSCMTFRRGEAPKFKIEIAVALLFEDLPRYCEWYRHHCRPAQR